MFTQLGAATQKGTKTMLKARIAKESGMGDKISKFFIEYLRHKCLVLFI